MPFITAAPTHFLRKERPFFALGFNAYYLGFCSNLTQQSVLHAAQLAGASAIRAWAFLDSDQPTGPVFQQFTPGGIQINEGESGLRQLDRLISNAEAAEIALVLPLINGWSDFGGMPLYARWFGGSSQAENFYSSSLARDAYRRWVEFLLTRRNTITGRLYSEEPSIMAWELANEPRHTGEDGQAILLDWVAESAAFLKSLDKNHLLAVGDEGFFRKRGRSHLYRGRYGVDTEAFLRLDTIDFGTYHLYPGHWNTKAGFARRWIEDHAALATRVGKPVVLEEFGLSTDRDSPRFSQYAEWAALACANGSAGALFWMLGSAEEDATNYRDRFTVYECPEFDPYGDNLERLRFVST